MDLRIGVIHTVKEIEISLTEALQPAIIEAYNRRATGEKFLIVPTKA